jgi:hypothetical protein
LSPLLGQAWGFGNPSVFPELSLLQVHKKCKTCSRQVRDLIIEEP